MFKKEGGFTLLEMLIVLLVITVLILLIVPNIGDRSDNVYDQGCEALTLTVQTQADAYRIETGAYPDTIKQLETDDFITENQLKCKNGDELEIKNGIVKTKNG